MIGIGIGPTFVRSGGGGFNPAAYGTLAAWYDFSDITTLFQNNASAITPVAADNDLIGTVVDKSESGNDIHSGIDAVRPTYKTGIQNGLSVARSDSAKILRSGAFTLNQTVTLFLVAKRSGDGANLVLMDGRTDLSLFLTRGAVQWSIYAGAFLSGGTADQAWHLFSIVLAGVSSVLRVDGAATASGNAGTTNMAGVTLFQRGNSAGGVAGDIGEVLIYAGTVADADRDTIESNLAAKWGI